MSKKLVTKFKTLTFKRRLAAAGAAFMAIILLVVVVQVVAPTRSVAAYCLTFAEEKARLAKLPGDTWPSGVFQDEISNAGEFAQAFSRMGKVAPNDIGDDVKTLEALYQKIHDDPSQAIAASLSGIEAEDNVKAWTGQNCLR